MTGYIMKAAIGIVLLIATAICALLTLPIYWAECIAKQHKRRTNGIGIDSEQRKAM